MRESTSVDNQLEIHHFRNIINLSEVYFSQSENHKELSTSLWLAEIDLENILRLLDEESGLPNGNTIILDLDSTTAKDIIQSLKYYFRHLAFFDKGHPFLENFISGIKQNTAEGIEQKAFYYQSCMQSLIKELISNHDSSRAYCLHEILHLIYMSLTSQEMDNTEVVPMVTSTIAPMFQEAFGYKDDNELIVPMFRAFAFIIRDPSYKDTFHSVYPDADPDLKLLSLAIQQESKEVDVYPDNDLGHSAAVLSSELDAKEDPKEDLKEDKEQAATILDTMIEQSTKREAMENSEQEKPKEEKNSEPAKAAVVNKLDHFIQSSLKKLQLLWSSAKPKLIQFCNLAYKKAKELALWCYPRLKDFAIKCWQLLCSGIKETYKMMVKKKDDTK